MNKKNNVVLHKIERSYIQLYDQKEVKTLFGEEALEKNGSRIPPEVIEMYRKNEEDFHYIQRLLIKTLSEGKKT